MISQSGVLAKTGSSVSAPAIDGSTAARNEMEYGQKDRQDRGQSHQVFSELEPRTGTDNLTGTDSLVSPSRLIFTGSCHTSSCLCWRGHFTSFNSKCINCAHKMAEHKYEMDHFPYDQTYVSLRQDLVRDMIKLLSVWEDFVACTIPLHSEIKCRYLLEHSC